MRRREFITLISGAAAWHGAPHAAIAQARPHRIGLLVTGGPAPQADAVVTGLRDLGYIEGRNLAIERRYAGGKLNLLPTLVAELVALKVEVIATVGTPATIAARDATTSIPIVFGANSDPVGVGVVASLARPGGNVTGTSLMSPDVSAKRLELLHTVMTRVARLAILWDSSNPGMAARVKETRTAADLTKVPLQIVGPTNLEQLELAFAELTAQKPDALLVTAEAFTRAHLTRILDYASKNKLPTMFEDRSWVEAGGLMSYGPNNIEVFRRAAVYVDKILKGAKPSELPVEQPTRFELVINLKAAKAIGFTISETFLARADEVIE